MRKIIVLLAICIGAAQGVAQEQPEPQTLLGGVEDFSLFVSPAVKGTVLNGQDALMVGGSAGVVLDRAFYIGATGYRLVTNVKIKGSGTDSIPTSMQYIGGVLGLRFNPDALLHFGVQGTIGYGEIRYRNGRDDDFEDIFDSHMAGIRGYSEFLMAELGATAEVNLVSRVQLGVDAGYRFCAGVDSATTGITNADLSGLSAGATLRFILF